MQDFVGDIVGLPAAGQLLLVGMPACGPPAVLYQGSSVAGGILGLPTAGQLPLVGMPAYGPPVVSYQGSSVEGLEEGILGPPTAN